MTAKIPIAVIGIGCIFPDSEDLKSFWSLIKNKKDAIKDIPKDRWKVEDHYDPDPKAPDKTYAKKCGSIPAIDFNPLEFAITPNAMEGIDTSQLVSLYVAKKALQDAGYLNYKKTDNGANKVKTFNKEKTSVIMGATGTQEIVIPLGARLSHPIWRNALREAGIDKESTEKIVKRISEGYVGWQESSFPGLLGNVVPGRIANVFDFGGTNCAIDTACASSLSAVHMANLELASGKSDMVLSGGVDTFNDIFMFMCFSKTPALSPSGKIRPFADDADGTMLGEGIGILVLKRLEDAEKDNDKIYALIRGVGTSSDGSGVAVFAPKSEGQVLALKEAYRNACIDPRTVELMEAHGTGTKAGDAAEFKSIKSVYSQSIKDPEKDPKKDRWCALGTVKSQIGHTKAAAGSAGLVKAIMALHHKVLPPTINIEKPLEGIESTPFYVNTEKRPWLPNPEHPRRAAVSAFGFGGSNFHCVLEEYTSDKTKIDWDDSIEIHAYSADSIDELKNKIDNIEKNDRIDVDGSSISFDPRKEHRLVIACEKGSLNIDKRIILTSLLDANKGKKSWSAPDGIFFGSGPVDGKLGILFPGQGAQYVGMLKDIACQFPQMFSILCEADNGFEKHKASEIKRRLSDYIYPIPVFDENDKAEQDKELNDTRVAQTSLGAVSLGALRVLQHFGVEPDAVAGHSFGELTALCAAGCISSDQLHALAALRGKLMAQKPGDLGSMLAVQSDFAAVEKAVKENNMELTIANRNSPTQVVLSGATEEIEKAAKVFDRLGIRNIRLSSSAAFHSPLVAKAQVPFGEALEKIDLKNACIPVFSNTTGREYPSNTDDMRRILAEQLARPVEFIDEIESMYDRGVRTFLEVGPKTILTGLVKNILKEKGTEIAAIALDASKGTKNGILDLAKTLAQLAAIGYNVDLSLWNPSSDHEKEELSRPKPKLTIPISGPNYVSPKEDKPLEPILFNMQKKEIGGKKMSKEDERNHAHLSIIQKNIENLHKLQEQTAIIHQQFLANQAAAIQAYQVLAGYRPSNGHAIGVEMPKIEMPRIEIPKIEVPRIDIPRKEMPKIEVPSAKPSVADNNLLAAAIPVATAAQSHSAPAVPVEPASQAATTAAAGVQYEVNKALISVIAEKTGYPAEMLELDMNLDTDLGIDSIKRVEIFSALKEKVPAAGEIKAEHMGTLKTLRDIISFIEKVDTGPPNTGSPPAVPVKQAVHDSNETKDALIAVIAEKTGYPAEMLELDMNLDTDLGIDSIKRVEIFSALKEKVPAAGEIKAEHMGTLKTLRDIVEFISSRGGESVSEPETAPVPAGQEKTEDSQEDQGNIGSIRRHVLTLAKLSAQDRKEKMMVPEESEIWITGGSRIARSVNEQLCSMHYKSRLVDLNELQNLSAPSVLGGLLVIAPEDDIDDSFLKDAFKLLRLSAPALRKTRGFFVTVSRLGLFGLKGLSSNPLSGGLAGLSKTAFHEWPEVNCKAIDIMPDFTNAIHVIDESFTRGPVEVALSNEGRFQIRLNQAQLDQSDDQGFPLEENDVILVTGGARGVTAECALEFAKKKPTLVLLGRSKAPEPEPEWLKQLGDEAAIKNMIIRLSADKGNKLTPRDLNAEYHRIIANRAMLQNIDKMKSAGAKVFYCPVDVNNKEGLRKTISEFAPVKGLIHGAGVLADKLIEDKNDDEFNKVYDTKVVGLRNLLSVLDQDELKLLILFSSSTGRFGRKGQVDYAVANEVLNKIAQQHSRLYPGCKTIAANWGPWDGGMVTPALKKVFLSEGIEVIPLKAGARYLVQEASSSENPVEVVIHGGDIGGIEDQADLVSGSSSRLSPGSSSGFSLAFEKEISVANHPVLKSHVMNGKAVLPTALMMEMLAHGALHANPGLKFCGVNGLRILRGVKIDKDESSIIKVLTGKPKKDENDFFVPVELRTGSKGGSNDKDMINVRAEIVLSTKRPEGKIRLSQSELSPTDLNGNAYKILFHGKDLRGIEHIAGCSEKGIAAKARKAPDPLSWITRPLRSAWIADPLVLDCCFQLMILWTHKVQGNLSLPTYVGTYAQFREFSNTVNINIRVKEKSANKAIADIELSDDKQNLIARIEDYECVVDPSLKNAFENNKIDEMDFKAER